MTEPPTTRRSTLPFIALSTIAAVFLAAGVIGLLQPDLTPLLASPSVAWSLIGVGLVIDGFAVAVLLVGRAERRVV